MAYKEQEMLSYM